MMTFSFSRCALSIGAIALLAACGGSQPPVGSPGAMPQSRAIATQTERSGSWMLPEAKGDKLLYASDIRHNVVVAYTYPEGKQVGKLSGFPASPGGLCTDSLGNVFVTTQGNGQSFSSSYVYEYAHGGSAPISMLNDPGFAKGCAIDPVTGDLAVTNNYAGTGDPNGNVAIYQSASGSPITYSDPNGGVLVWCTYDENGNLFANGNVLDELVAGSNGLNQVKIRGIGDTGSIQWNRGRLIIAAEGPGGPETLYKVKVERGVGKIEGTITLSSIRDKRANGQVQYWIEGARVIGPGLADGGNILLQVWKFPQGGFPVRTIHPHNLIRTFQGVTVSVAPSR